MKFSLDSYGKETPKKLIRLMTAIKGAIGTISVATFLTDHPNWAFGLLVAGAILDEAVKFFSEENDQRTNN